MKKVFLTLVMFLLAFTGVVRADELTVHDGSATSGYVPVYGWYADAYLKCEMVYPATELVDMANSEISQMTFYASQSSVDWGTAEFQVFLAEVADATISAFAGPGTVVYEGSLGISGSQMVVTFDTPFTYTGGNLLVGVYETTIGGYVTSTWYGETVTGACVQGYSYSSLSDITAGQKNFLPKTTFEYQATTPVLPTITETIEIGDGGTATNSYLPIYPFYNYSLTQQLYTPDEIGYEGTINSVAFYTTASVTRTIDIYMVNTTVASFSSNNDWIVATASDKVYSGTVTMTANDWTTITLDTPFEYDGTSNLALIVDDNTGTYVSSVPFYVFDATGMALRVYNDYTNYDPTSSASMSGVGAVLNVKNQIQLEITHVSTVPPLAPGFNVSPDPIDLGDRPIGVWSEPMTVNLQYGGGTVTVNGFEVDNEFFTINAEVPFTLGEDTVKIEIGVNPDATVTEGDQDGNMVILYTADDRSAIIFPISAFAYAPASGDVFEDPVLVTSFPYSEMTPTGIRHNYTLEGGDPDAFDAVYKMTFANDVLFSASNSGADPVVFLYNEDFDGQDGPGVDNYYEYNGPEVGPDPFTFWFNPYSYTGGVVWTGLQAGGGWYFGYKIPASLIAEYELSTASIVTVEAAAREAYPYDLYVIRGGANPGAGELVGYQPMNFNPEPMYYFSLNLAEPVLCGTDDLYIIFYSDSPYAAYVGKDPVDSTNGGLWTMNPNATTPAWAYNSARSPLMYVYFVEIPTGREVRMNLADMSIEYMPTGKVLEVGEVETETKAKHDVKIAAQAPVIANHTNRATSYTDMFVPAGTYYAVFASTDNSFQVDMSIDDVPAPDQAYMYSPYDGQTDVYNYWLAQWDLGYYTTEMQVLLDATYPPTTPLIDWTDQLVNSCFLTGLDNNKTYFMQVNARNEAGTTEGAIIGFTTIIDPVQGLTVESNKVFNDETITLNWEANRNLTGYNVYRDGVLVGNTTETTYVDGPLAYNMAGYEYYVTAVYNEGESYPSDVVTVRVSGYGDVNGHVWEIDSITPVYNAAIELQGVNEFGDEEIIALPENTNPSGYYEGHIHAGTYQAVARKDGYMDNPTESFVVAYDNTTDDVDIYMLEDPLPLGMIKATLQEEENNVLVEWSWDPASLIVDFETGDFSQAEFTLPATYPWAITTNNPHEGTYCIKSTCEGVASGASVIEATVDVPYDGKMGFYVKVSSESNYDKFHFYIDGVEQGQALSGVVNWTQKEFAVTEGTHTYKWEYQKDSSVNSNEDCVYVDDITMYRLDTPVVGGNFYDFEDSSLQGWTTIDGGSPTGYGWQLVSGKIGTGYGHNGSTDAVMSQSYDNNYGVVYPDNYLVSPSKIQARNGAAINFFACAQDASYAAEHFGVAVSTTTNAAASFTTIQEWTMTAKGAQGKNAESEFDIRGTRDQGSWYEYTVDLSSYAGQEIWVAIRHFNCSDMFYLLVDDITLSDGSAKREGEQNRTLQGYTLYRANINGTVGDTLEIAHPAIDVMSYIDNEWASLPYGIYKWGIQANYEGNHHYAEKRALQAVIEEGFEAGSMPEGWTSEGASTWTVGTGDYSASTGAANGTYNAKITHTTSGTSTFLVSPVLNLAGASVGTVSCNFINRSWLGDIDEFGVYYRVDGGTWNEIYSTSAAHASWTNTGDLDLTGFAANYQIGFKYTDHYGYGVGIDDVVVMSNASGSSAGGGANNSDILWSNEIEKDMEAQIIFHITLNNDQDPAGATVTMVGAENTYEGTFEADTLVFEAVRKGNYQVTAELEGYETVTLDMLIEEDAEYDIFLEEILEVVEDLYVSPTAFAVWNTSTATNGPTAGSGSSIGGHTGGGGGGGGGGAATTFTEGFESGMPDGWTVVDGNNDGWTWCLTSDIPSTWTYYTMTIDWYRTGTNAICSGSYINGVGALTPNEYLVSPQLTLAAGSTFSFWAAATDASYPADHFGVFVSDDATNWTSVQEWTLTAKAGGNDGGRASRDGNGAKLGTWYQYTVDLSAYAGQKYIAIRHFNCTDQYIMCVDDMELTDGSKGDRYAVRYKVKLDGVYEGETPNMFWQHNEDNLTEGETYTTSVAPVYATGMGEWVDYTWTYQDCSHFTGVTDVTAVENEPGTAVEVNWTMPEGVTPPGPGTGTATTFTEGFESGMPDGWTVVDGNNDGWTWCLTSNIPSTWTYYASLTLDWYHTGTNAICSGSYINGVGALTPNEYLVTDQVTLAAGSTFSFYAAATDASYPADHFGVFVSDNATDWTMVQEWTLTAKSNGNGGRASRDGNGAKLGAWYQYSVDLSTYAGEKYIAIRHFNCTDQYIMVVDDIELSDGSKGNRDMWDLVTTFTGTSAGQQAVATDGNYIYTASWQTTPTGGNTFYKYELDGTFVEGFDISGATGIRDLTFDGDYFYGTSGGANIFILDLANKTMVGTMNFSGCTSRHISYDPERDGFWCGNWSTLALYSRSGAVVQNGAAPTSAYGSAYYKDADDVEHLFLFCQPDSDCKVYDYNIATNTISSSVVYDYTNNVPGCTGIAGGCFIGTYDNKTCWFGNAQQDPNLIAIVELDANAGPTPPPTPVEGIMGSVLLRDGEIIAMFLGDEAGTNSYIDEDVEIGEHEYCVRVIYGGDPDVTLWAMSCPVCATVDYTSVAENDVVDNLYPNPTRDVVTIEAQAMNHITVVNTLGQVVYDADVDADMIQLNLGQYKAGLYLIRVNTESGVSVKRVTLVK